MATASAEQSPSQSRRLARLATVALACAAAASLLSCACDTVPGSPSGASSAASRAEPSSAASEAPAPAGPVTVLERARVQRAVREVFMYMQAGNCERMMPLLGGEARARIERRGGCAQVVQREPETLRLQLRRMSEIRRDGRNADAFMVNATVQGDGEDAREQELILRVQRSGEQYRVVAM